MAEERRTLSTHILDISLGKPAAGVPITVYSLNEQQQWVELKKTVSNADGRTGQLIEIEDFKSGVYKLKFDVQNYCNVLNLACLYPYIEIIVQCVVGQHYHIPLLLTSFGYSTYRGS